MPADPVDSRPESWTVANNHPRPRSAATTHPDGSAASADLVGRRLVNQRLIAARDTSPESVVTGLGAVQAQDYLGAKWAVAQRAGACTDAAVEDALDRGAILRTHVLRPTWHFVAPADIRWLLALTAPRVHALNAPYNRQTGLDARAFTRGDAALAKALQGQHYLTRDELRAVLREAGVAADGLRLALLLMHAELEGVICSGPRRGKQFTYAALDERAPATPALQRDEALAELARRYFASHGPARPRDLAWWSGLRVTDAQAAIRMLGTAVESRVVGDETYWRATGARRPRRRPAPRVHLLPSYDEYVIGYRDHAPIMDAAHAATLGVRGGLVGASVVIVDGCVAGSWRRTLRRAGVAIEVKLLLPLDDAARAALARETERYGRFLSLPARLDVSVPRRAREKKR